MKFALIAVTVVLCIIVGYAARQMQTLRENDEKMKAQSREFEKLIRENEVLSRAKGTKTQAIEIDRLTRENNELRQAAQDHVGNLEMVLAELPVKQEANA
jgi:cellulose biosynthesis protein BcsQ